MFEILNFIYYNVRKTFKCLGLRDRTQNNYDLILRVQKVRFIVEFSPENQCKSTYNGVERIYYHTTLRTNGMLKNGWRSETKL